jgi:phosphoesterase RecJ-like protein
VEVRAAIAQALTASARILIACHSGPDGDGLGSGLALALALERLGRAATVACQDGVPENLAFLPGADRVVRAAPVGATFDAAVTIECSTLDRAGTLAAAVGAAPLVVAIDHHEDHRPYAHLIDLDPTAAAAGEQVADLIRRLGVEIDRAMATNLLTAILTDTGVFRFPNTTPRALRLAADLIERGAVAHEIVRAVYEEQPAAALRVLGAALQRIELREGGAVALTVVTPEMLAAAGAGPEDVQGIAAVLRTIRGVRLALVFEQRADAVRVSIRARDGARANAVAQALGGGGHPGAAGAEVARPLREVVALALDAAGGEIRRSA